MPGPEPRAPIARLWEYRGPAPFDAAAAVVDGLVYVADTAGNVSCLELAGGQVRWTRHIANGPLGSPTVAASTVFVGTPVGLTAVDAISGAPRWSVQTDGPIDGAPAIDGGRVVVASEAGTIEALDASTGRVAWQASTGAAVTRSLAIVTEMVLAGLRGGSVVALGLADGTVRWRAETGDSGDVGTIVAVGDRVYATTGLDAPGAKHEIVALDGTSGSVEWRYSSRLGAPAYPPAVADGLAVVASDDDTVVALDTATGEVRWSFKTAAPDETVAIVGGTVVSADNAGRVYGLDLAHGTESWTATVRGGPFVPTVADGVVLVPTSLGLIDALGSAR